MRAGGLDPVTIALAAASTAGDVADVVLLEGAAAFDADAAVMCRLGDDGVLEVVASKGYPAAALRVLVSAPVAELAVPLATAVRTGAPVLLEEDDAGGAVAAVALRDAAGVAGGIAFRFDAAQAFTSEDRAALVAVADAAGHALERGALAERVAVLGGILDTAPVGLGVVDERFRFDIANPQLRRVLAAGGRAAEDALGAIAQSVLDADAPVVGVELVDFAVLVSAYPLATTGGTRRVGVVVTPVTADGERELRVREQLAVLAEAGRVLSSSLDVDDVLAEVADLVVPALADACMIDLAREDGTVRRVATAGGDVALVHGLESHAPGPDDAVKPTLRRIRTSTSVEVVEVDEAFVRASWPDDPAYQRLLLERVRWGAVVPMTSRDATVGRLTLLMGASGRDFHAGDAPMLLDLGRRIAVAVENARLFSRQRSVAIALQQSLLPDRLPDVPGVSMAARYLPGGPDVDVGGDWYDVLPMPDGTIGFAMGDVVGRGVRAAALMGQLRSALRGYALEGHRPGACLEQLDVLLNVITGGALVTAVKGHLYPSERRAVLANAGHLPPLVLRPDGDVEFVAESLGVPLSTLDVPRYDDIWLDLAPGTTIVLYTDGLVEERDSSLEVGLTRLAEACRSGPRHDLEALCDHILTSLLGARTTRDDVALLVVRLDA